MDLVWAYQHMAAMLTEKNLLPKEGMTGKSVLVIGENIIKKKMPDGMFTPCELIKNYVMAAGASECDIFGNAGGWTPSAAQLATPGYYYGIFDEMDACLPPGKVYDRIVLLEGWERVYSFRAFARTLHQRCAAPEGVLYLVTRTSGDVTGGPVSTVFWYEDVWRFEARDMNELFPDCPRQIYGLMCDGGSFWDLSIIKHREIREVSPTCRIYSCRAGRKIIEDELPKLGYFHQTGLDILGEREVTDKSRHAHNYLPKYEHFLAPLRDEKFTLLELGVYRGGSAKMWQTYFQQAEIVGVDIDPYCSRYAGDRIKIEIMDLAREENIRALRKYAPRVIVDDASHLWSHQIKALFNLFDVLPSGGIYILEDMETSVNREEFPGFNDFPLDAYTVCERISRVVVGKEPCLIEPFAREITAIGMAIEMIATIKGSCIMIKR